VLWIQFSSKIIRSKGTDDGKKLIEVKAKKNKKELSICEQKE